MASFMKEYENLRIHLKDIKSATNNFDENKVIGNGGFGKVYEGELCHSNSEKKSLVALKRLDRKYGQGDPQFWKEIMMLSRYRHENLISLLGYCIEDGEMILIYEHAARGSLERYLKDATLTWTERIKICLDAAKGLSFLHDPNERQQRVLHCDIKSANILLDDNLNAKVSDFGLSKMGSADQQYSVIVTNAVGTPGYCDPLYMETYQLTKESDVYSFGVVLFEVLCGRQCVEFNNGQLNVFVPFWKKTYEENKLVDIIFKDLEQQINPSALETFASIAYQCLKRSREERPLMSLVVEKLKNAFEVQERHDIISKIPLPKEYEEIVQSATSPLMYTSIEELKGLVSKGVLVNKGKTWLYVTEKGEHIERIYIEAYINRDKLHYPSGDIVNSRFPGGLCYDYYWDFKARVRGQYLTPQISYMVNLVFRYWRRPYVNKYEPLIRYKVDGEETKVCIIYPTYMRQDGWFIAPLYQFTSQHKTADIQFEFESRSTHLIVAGIEFQPSEEKVELQEYQDIVKATSHPLFYTSLDELKQILSIGVHLNGYKTWFSLNEKGEHCEMISIEDCLIPNENSPSRYWSYWWSRFPKGLYRTCYMGLYVKTKLLSPLITYTVNLVFHVSSYRGQSYVDLKYRLRGETTTSTVYLANPRKDDDFFSAELYQFTNDGSIVDLEIIIENFANIDGVECIMFQPLEIVEDQVSKDDKVESIQTISDSASDTYWEQKFPDEYEEIINLSKDSLRWTTKKELYSIFRRGFLLGNGQQWFAVDKHGKKCLMLSAKATCVIDGKNLACKSLNETRFGEVLVVAATDEFRISGQIKSEVVSPETNYACYLVYKLPQDQSTFEAPLFVRKIDGNNDHLGWYIYLVSPPDTPVIGPKVDENTHKVLDRHKVNAVPQQRSDSWMEVQVWEFETGTTTNTFSMYLVFEHPGEKNLTGLMVQGIELRPI
ncbi:kinase-like domain, phloem protein 2-like protein [Tanacetum coccineum]